MLKELDMETAASPASGMACADGEGAAGVGELVARLRAVRVEARLLAAAGGFTAGGTALRVPVAETLQSKARLGQVMRHVVTLVRENMPLTLSLRELGGVDAAIAALEEFCTAVRDVLLSEKLSSDGIGVSMQSHLVPLEAYRLISAAVLGRGPRYVMLDSLQMRHHDNERVQEETDNNWSFLWRCRSLEAGLVPAYAASVTTHCALLGDEAATTVLPELGIQVPVGTAWLPLVLHLPDFSDGRGGLSWDDLENALCRSVELGERLLDRLFWPDPVLERDARQNRRLGITVGGIGDLVLESGANPADLGCLQRVDKLVARLHRLLWDRSGALARRLGPLPSLTQAEPTAGWHCDRSRADWQLRWRRALQSSAVRHRNLLVMSPYSVLPARAAKASDYVDLLPVLGHADAFCFADPPGDCFRNVAEFAGFHRRAWSVMQRRNAASLIATGV